MSSDSNQAMQNENLPPEAEGVDIRHYLYLAWQWLWLLVLEAAVVGGVTYLISQRMTPVFSTSTKLLVMEAASNKPADYTSLLASERLAQTYADMITNEALLQETIDRLGMQTTPAELAKSIKASPVQDTQLITVTVEGASPALIARIANTLVQVLIERVSAIQSDRYSNSEQSLSAQLTDIDALLQDLQNQMDQTADPAEKARLDDQAVQYRQIYANLLTTYEQTRLAEAQSSANIVQVNQAQMPMIAIKPKVLQNTLLAAFLSALVVAGGIFLIDAFDDTIKTPGQVTKTFGLPVLGVIIQHRNGLGPICQDQPRSPVSEAFRSLRTNIQYSNIDAPLRTLLVTSPSPREGKTLVCANLAVVFAQGGKNVILVDADLRRPAVHKRLEVSNNIGLTNLLLQPEIVLDGMLQKTKTANLSVVSAGDLPPNPAELLGTRKMRLILDKLKEGMNILVIDSPPVLPVADPSVLAPIVDGVLLVLQPGKTTLSEARDTVERLRRVNAKIIGIILNNVDLKGSSYHYFYRKNYHYYRENKYYKDENPSGEQNFSGTGNL
jgi:polysaccharide biosynthesis transport protein